MLVTLTPPTGIPTEEEWRDWPLESKRYLDLDEDYARRQFLGKSFEEAVAMFRDSNVLMRAEDVGYMPPIPFRYYMLAFAAHMLAGAPTTVRDCPSDAANSFLSLVEGKLEAERSWIAPILPRIMPIVELVATNQKTYDAGIEIYGVFLERLAHIKKLQGA